MTRAAAIALAVAGCNWVYGLESTTQVGVAVRDPLPYDPNRYTHVESSGGYTWNQAAAACEFVGYELAVLDDRDLVELSQQLHGGVSPFWLGASFADPKWIAVDGCTPALIWDPNVPPMPKTGDCVLQSSPGMRDYDCQQFLFDGLPINALCEAKRPDVLCSAFALQRNYKVITSTITSPVTHDDAAQQCAAISMHVIEIDSTDELNAVLAGVAVNVPKFWIGATQANATWKSPTGCPQIFTWATGAPTTSGGTDCVYYDGRMNNYYCNDANNQTAAAICELHAM